MKCGKFYVHLKSMMSGAFIWAQFGVGIHDRPENAPKSWKRCFFDEAQMKGKMVMKSGDL